MQPISHGAGSDCARDSWCIANRCLRCSAETCRDFPMVGFDKTKPGNPSNQVIHLFIYNLFISMFSPINMILLWYFVVRISILDKYPWDFGGNSLFSNLVSGFRCNVALSPGTEQVNSTFLAGELQHLQNFPVPQKLESQFHPMVDQQLSHLYGNETPTSWHDFLLNSKFLLI